ncbi:SwmB domain-containing protein, partial [Endozoicomonas montiporae]
SSLDSGSNNDRIEDLRGFDAAALSHGDVTVTNITDTISPSLSGAEVDGDTLTLTFSEELNHDATINPSLFSISVDGQSEPVSSLAINGRQIVLTLSGAVTDGQEVSLDYNPPSADSAPDNDRVEDLVGNDGSTVSSFSVTNLTNSEGNPEVLRLYSDDPDQWYRDGDTITVKVQFSERVEVTGQPTLQLETGTVDRLASYSGGSGTDTLLFTYTVNNPDESADLNALSTSALDLNGGTITDLLNNNADLLLPALDSSQALAQQGDIRIDTVSPTAGISSSSASSAGILVLSGSGFSSLLSPGEATDTDLTGRLDWSKLSWRVVDNSGSHTDIGFTRSDIDSALAVNDQQLTIKIGAGKLSTLRATSGFGNDNGQDLIRITSDGFFQDAAGNTMNDSNSAGVEIFILPPDGIAPTVTGITSLTADGEYAIGSVIRLQVSFDEAVEVTGMPVLLMGTGDNITAARFSSGSGTQELVFEYTVQVGDEASDLDVLSASALQLNGGTIKDLSGNAAVLAVPVAGNSDSLAGQSDLMIDGTAPDVSITGVNLAPDGVDDQKLTIIGSGFDTLLGSGESAGLSLQGDDLSRFDWSRLTLGLRQPDNSVDSVSLEQSDIRSVVINNNQVEIVIDEGVNKVLDNNGFSTTNGDMTLSLAEGFMADRAGNRSTTDALTDEAVSVTTNGAAVVSVSADTADGNYNDGDEILIRVRFSEKVTLQNYDANNDPLLLLLNDKLPSQGDPYGGNAGYVSGSGTREFVFRHTITAGENIDDLNYRDTSSLTFSNSLFGLPAASSLVNGAGNNVTLTLPATGSAESLAANSQIVVDTDAPATTISGAAYDESNNQLLLQGADFDQLLNSEESATSDISGRLDWSRLVIDIDADGDITRNITFSGDDIVSARLAGNNMLTIQLDDAKAAELEGAFGYKGAADGLDIQAGFLRDLAGNESSASTSDLTLDYADSAAPTVVRVSLEEPGSYKPGDEVVILLALSEVVNITGVNANDDQTKPSLLLDNGATAYYESGAGSDTLKFIYTVSNSNSETSGGLNYSATHSLSIPAGTMVIDNAGNGMITTLPAVDSSDALAQTGTAIVDVAAPEIQQIRSLTPDGDYNEGKLIQIEVAMNEVVDVTGAPVLNLDSGGQATYASGSGTDRLIFNYLVSGGENETDLDVSGISLSGASIQDRAGNDLDTTSLPTGNDINSLASQSDIQVDTTSPQFDIDKVRYRTDAFVIDLDYDHSFLTQGENLASQYDIDWSKMVLSGTDDFGNPTSYFFKDNDIDSFIVHPSMTSRLVLKLTDSGLENWISWEGYSYFANYINGKGDNQDMDIQIDAGWLADSAGNLSTFQVSKQALYQDSWDGSNSKVATELKDINSTSESGIYKAGDVINITVSFNQKVIVDTTSGTPTLTLNNGQTATLVESGGTKARVFNFSYTVQAGDSVNDLDVVSINNNGGRFYGGGGPNNGTVDVSSAVVSSLDSEDTLAGSKEIHIDTTAPATTISSAQYDPDTNMLVLDGVGFNGILSANAPADSTELRLVLDWSKLSYQVNGSLTESFSEDDVLSAKVVDNSTLIIELAASKAESIETNSGGDYSNDEVDIAAGFIRDLAGNVATTDALSSGSVSESDLKAPDLTSSLASNNELVLGFSEVLSGSPSTSDFSVRVDGSNRLVTNVSVNGQEVTVTFDGSQIDNSGQLLFSYTGSSLSDSDGNAVSAISDRMAGFSHASGNALDTLIGDIGDDIFTIDHDDVTATGGLGADTFDFNASGTAQNPSELIITDFNTDEGDMLKLDDILVDPNDDLDEHFHFVSSGDDTVMEISDTANGDVTKKVTFKDVDLFALGSTDADILNHLMNNNNLDHGSSS